MIARLLGLFTSAGWLKLAGYALALLVVESPAIYLFITRAQVQDQLATVTKKYDVDEQSIGTLRAQLAQSQADLAASQKAAQAASDSVGAYKLAMSQAAAAAFAAKAQQAQAEQALQSLAAKRAQQVAAPAAAKESCDAAIDDLRAGR